MRFHLIGGFFTLVAAMLISEEGRAQTEETPPAAEDTTETPPAAEGTTETPPADAAPTTETTPDADVPPVEVIQPKPKPEPAPVIEAKPKPQPRPAPRPVVQAPPAPPPAQPAPVEPTPIEPELVLPSLITQPTLQYYGPPGGQGNYDRTMHSSQSPIVPIQGIIPGDLSDFSSAASRVTRQQINEQDPLTTNDILSRVPGVAILNDDGLGRHGGISVRGTPARRSRKVAVLEDGRFINQSIWLDPSTHYVPPPDRIESVEVLRGTVIVYGPNNNSGVVNFRNLQPFGPNESVVSVQGGSVALTGGHFEDVNRALDDGDATKWHAHTRQSVNANGNRWGLVLSYTGANAQGAWDTERLRYDDFYAALGWAGVKSDFTFTTVYFAQRDNYDESNFEGEDDGAPGELEREFFNDIKHCKTCFNPASKLNEYNADILLMQGIYNYYVNTDTTVSARVYGQVMDRARFFNIEGANPLEAEGNSRPIVDGDEVLAAEGTMEGRYRTFDHIGTELRTEFANRPFLFGLSQDVQAGVRYEHHEFVDRSFLGREGQVLKNFNSRGLDVWNRDFTADAFSAFLQTDIAVTDQLSVVPGVRLENYHISRLTKAITTDDEEGVGPDCDALGVDECIIFEGYSDDPFNEKFTRTHVLPGVAFAWGFGAKEVPVDYGKLLKPLPKPQYKSTVYGGYHRGLTMGVLRETDFPPGDELGDNYQIGLRSTAIKGLTFDIAGFHQNIQDYQFRSELTLAGDRSFEAVDEVHVNGFEAYGRLDTRPFTGWRLNPYTEASFTLADTKVEKGTTLDEDDVEVSVAGNYIPEVPREFAYLTAGIESTAGWNASVSWIYRGSFYTDILNTPFGGDPEGEAGLVPSVWLLAARANYTVSLNGTEAVFFVSGENLTNELYITDREDGIKPGIGRTIMAGAKIKW
jgi:Fe(3+) dicitrate transport protein